MRYRYEIGIVAICLCIGIGAGVLWYSTEKIERTKAAKVAVVEDDGRVASAISKARQEKITFKVTLVEDKPPPMPAVVDDVPKAPPMTVEKSSSVQPLYESIYKPTDRPPELTATVAPAPTLVSPTEEAAPEPKEEPKVEAKPEFKKGELNKIPVFEVGWQAAMDNIKDGRITVPRSGTHPFDDGWNGAIEEAKRKGMISSQPATKSEPKHEKDFLYFGAVWCGPCKTMKATTFEDAGVKKALEKFNVRFLDVDKDPALTEKYGVTRVPSYFVVNGNGDVEKRAVGIKTGDAFINWLEGKKSLLDTFQKKNPVDVGYRPRLAYTEAVQESLRSGKTLLTWNGIDVARQFRGAVVDTHLEEPLTGFKRGLLVGVPRDGKVWTVATLPFDATADDVMRALSSGTLVSESRGFQPGGMVVRQEMSHQAGACQSCGQNHGPMMGAPRMMSGSGWSSGSRMGSGGGMMMRGGGGRSGGG